MIKKSKIFLLAMTLVLAFAQVSFAALSAVGPVMPDTDPGPGWSADYNGFPLWYRDSLGQTVSLLATPPLARPLSALSIPDPIIPGNAFSAHIGFGSEAMYWHSTASIDGPNGNSLLVLALEAAFGGGDAADGDQIVFQRIRIRIDAPIAGVYTVTHPYGTKTFTVAPADVGVRAINDTVDIGVTSFAAALQGAVGPLLKQVNAPGGSLGDAATPAPVVNGPNGNIFRVQGPNALDVQTNLFVTGAKLFIGTPFTVTRSTFTRGPSGIFADVFANTPAPVFPGVALTAAVPGGTPVPMVRQGQRFFARVPITGAFTPQMQVTVTGTTNGVNPTSLNGTLVDVVNILQATYSVSTQTLTIRAVTTDSLAAVRGFGWVGATNAGQPLLAGGNPTVFNNVIFPPISITAKSSSGGAAVLRTFIVP